MEIIIKGNLRRSFKNGKLQSFDDKPSESYAGSFYMWHKNGELHRETGPAVIYVTHREGVKQIEYKDDAKFTFGVRVKSVVKELNIESKCDEELNKLLNEGLPKEYLKLNNEISIATIYYFAYYLDGKLHREGLPAVVSRNYNTKEFVYLIYYNDGKRHRKDGPAVVKADGSYEYFDDGKRHRVDGSAVKKYMNNGVYEEWWDDGVVHRTDGPAVSFTWSKLNGGVCDYTKITEKWYCKGIVHRSDGPAVMKTVVRKKQRVEFYYEYWTNGVCISKSNGVKKIQNYSVVDAVNLTVIVLASMLIMLWIHFLE